MTTNPPELPNGDTNYMYVESFLQFGEPLPPESDTSIDQKDVDQLSLYYNSEVNLMLADMGFVFPLSPPDAAAIQWVRWTKTLAVAGYALKGIAAQSGDESADDRASQLLEDYEARLTRLAEDNGDFLDLGKDPDQQPSRVPVPLTIGTSEEVLKSITRRKLRFEQLVRVERHENEEFIADHAPDEWLNLIGGV